MTLTQERRAIWQAKEIYRQASPEARAACRARLLVVQGGRTRWFRKPRRRR